MLDRHRTSRFGVRRARQIVAQRIWHVAHWIYPYIKHEPDGVTERFFTMEATFIGTEADADRLFDRLSSLDCGEDAHPLHDCRFAVGGMRWEPFDADEDDE